MKLFYTERFRQGYESAKKYDKERRIWQARVNGGWRFYFIIEGNIYRLLSIRPHPR